MRTSLFLLFAIALPALAGVGTLTKAPFFGAFAAKEERKANYRVMPNGQFIVNVLNEDGREFSTGEIKLRFFLQERQAKDETRWSFRRFDPVLAESPIEPTTEPGKVEMTLTASNGAKVKLTYQFRDKGWVDFDIELLDKGQAKRPLRVGYDLQLPDFHSRGQWESERDMLRDTKKTRITFMNDDDGKERLPMSLKREDFLKKHSKLLDGSYPSILIESDSLYGADFELRVSPKGGGRLSYEGKAEVYLFDRGKFRILLDPAFRKEEPLGSFRIK